MIADGFISSGDHISLIFTCSKLLNSPFDDLTCSWTGAVITKDLQAQVLKAAVTKCMLREDGPQVGNVGDLEICTSCNHATNEHTCLGLYRYCSYLSRDTYMKLRYSNVLINCRIRWG